MPALNVNSLSTPRVTQFERQQQLRALVRYLESRNAIWERAYELEKQRHQWARPPSDATTMLRNTAARRYRLVMWVLRQLNEG